MCVLAGGSLGTGISKIKFLTAFFPFTWRVLTAGMPAADLTAGSHCPGPSCSGPNRRNSAPISPRFPGLPWPSCSRLSPLQTRVPVSSLGLKLDCGDTSIGTCHNRSGVWLMFSSRVSCVSVTEKGPSPSIFAGGSGLELGWDVVAPIIVFPMLISHK